MKTKTGFTPYDIEKLAPAEKMGLLATVNHEGLPHITFINSLMPVGENVLTLGQFIIGNSKWFIQNNPKISFFMLSPLEKKMWTGKALWTHKKSSGPELETYKNMDIQRYNAYFPINLVHYFDLVETSQPMNLPIFNMLIATLLTKYAKSSAKTGITDKILTPYAHTLFSSLVTMKFICFVKEDGFPCLIPFIQCMNSDSRRIVFYPNALKDYKNNLAPGMDMAVFCLKANLESVLVRGKFLGYKRFRGVKLGIIDINWVYNSMAPNAGQIYPGIKLEPVVNF
ncbi:MAG: hypothetical protein KKD21_03315 [Proteobacteria bacterium]|nr:hypothetical protein [Pseudomonadota bacterium]MBU1696058.1 hypothetical protein [Pseudomonadota bacterium]